MSGMDRLELIQVGCDMAIQAFRLQPISRKARLWVVWLDSKWAKIMLMWGGRMCVHALVSAGIHVPVCIDSRNIEAIDLIPFSQFALSDANLNLSKRAEAEGGRVVGPLLVPCVLCTAKVRRRNRMERLIRRNLLKHSQPWQLARAGFSRSNFRFLAVPGLIPFAQLMLDANLSEWKSSDHRPTTLQLHAYYAQHKRDNGTE
ncbi:hypothetical protein FB446DRAFT_263693 [Lentinula raphanica]|nr:hypothetical protein FB446DRAFT_263693 [Lentinula raphanica]